MGSTFISIIIITHFFAANYKYNIGKKHEKHQYKKMKKSMHSMKSKVQIY